MDKFRFAIPISSNGSFIFFVFNCLQNLKNGDHHHYLERSHRN